MRLRQYLAESEEIVDIIKAIKRDCKPWLKESNYRLAWRGMKGKEPILKKKVRKDRKPRDTKEYIHSDMDEYFKKHFGWKPRSEGMFCTGDMYEAARYGSPYVVFPIGNYRYLWSPQVRDSYKDTFKFSTWFIELTSFIFKDESGYMESMETTRMLKKYTDKDLERALKSKNEVMIDCEEYYAIRSDVLFKLDKRKSTDLDPMYNNWNEFIEDLK